MKKTGMIIFLALNLFLLTNCNKDDQKEGAKTDVQIEAQEKREFTEKEKKIIGLFNKDSLEKFLENTKKIKDELKNSSVDEANKLYRKCRDFFEENEKTIPELIENLNTEHRNILDLIYPYVGEVPEDKISEETVKEVLNKFLADYGLRIKYVGEGYYEMDVIASFYYDLFKDYVSDYYKEYLRITAKEDEEIFASDGGLLIEYEELGDRIVIWENFLEKYPNGDLNSLINDNCNMYRSIYILGLPNTPTMDEDENGKIKGIYEENIEEFNRFMKKYPDSPTVELIKYIIKNYKNKNIFEEIDKMLEQGRKY